MLRRDIYCIRAIKLIKNLGDINKYNYSILTLLVAIQQYFAVQHQL